MKFIRYVFLTISILNLSFSVTDVEETDIYINNERQDIDAECVYEHIDIFDEFIEGLNDDEKELFTDEFIYELLFSCDENELNPWLVIGFIQAESQYNPNAKAYDGSGHYGLMQLSTTYFKLDDYFDPIENMRHGCKYIRKLMDESEYYACIVNAPLDFSFEDKHKLFVANSYNKGMGTAINIWKSDNFGIDSLGWYPIQILNFEKTYTSLYGSIDIKETIKDKKKVNAKLSTSNVRRMNDEESLFKITE